MLSFSYSYIDWNDIDWNDYSHVSPIIVEKTIFYVHSAKQRMYGEVFAKRFLINYCTTFSHIQKLVP